MLKWIFYLLVIFIASQVKLEMDYIQQRTHYPVGEDDVLKVDIDESTAANGKIEETFVFLHGWPDTNALWAPTAKQLCQSPNGEAKEGAATPRRCIRIDLPGYDLVTEETQHRRMGYTFEETLRLIAQTIRAHVDLKGGERFTLIGHDWGASFVHFLLMDLDQDIDARGNYVTGGRSEQERKLLPISKAIRRAVIVDVGLVTKPSPAFSLLFVAYQGANNLLFIAPHAVGTWLLERVVLPFFQFPSYAGQAVGAHMNWPYRSLWRDLITLQV
jgi:pimeloyl-ACP methyl ester carboxylesterase